MERYKNLRGASSVTAYEIGDDSITVKFSDGAVYLYNSRSAGRGNIEVMKELAVAGHGLHRFIVRRVRKAYAAKLR